MDDEYEYAEAEEEYEEFDPVRAYERMKKLIETECQDDEGNGDE